MDGQTSAGVRVADTGESWFGRFGAWVLLALFVAIHGLFLAGDLTHPDRFMMGDRAAQRLDKIHGWLGAPAGQALRTLAGAGPPGDYVLHGVLLVVGGVLAVLLVQGLMQLSLVLGAQALMRRIDGRPAVAFWAGLLALLLPGGLMSPHMLASETFATWFACLGVGLVCWAHTMEDAGAAERTVVVGFILMGLAAFVRPQSILMPALLFLTLPLMGYRLRPVLIGMACAVLVFPLSEMIFNKLVAGHFGLGESEADLDSNLFIRVQRLAQIGIVPAPQGDRLGVGAFLSIVAHHPIPALRLYITDAINLIANPGANHVFGLYLHLFPTEDPHHWHDVLDKSGPLAVVAEVVRQGGLFLILFVLAALVHLAVLTGTVVSTVVATRKAAPVWLKVMLLAAFSILIGSFAAGAVRWSHRAPVEPLLACAAVFGLAFLVNAARSRRARA